MVSIPISVSCLLLASSGPAPEEPIASFEPCVQWYGSDTSRRVEGWERITEAKLWRELWLHHEGEGIEQLRIGVPAVPRIDWQRCMVLARFDPDAQSCYGVVIERVDEFEDHLRVRFGSYTYQTASFGGDPPPAARGCYGIFVLPRSDKPIVIEEKAQRLKDGPVVWEQRVRMPALPDAGSP